MLCYAKAIEAVKLVSSRFYGSLALQSIDRSLMRGTSAEVATVFKSLVHVVGDALFLLQPNS